MAVYKYNATDLGGNKKTGIVDARTEELAVSLLKSQGLFVVSLQEKKESFIEELLSFRGVPGTELVSFTRQFSTMISAGLPIARALEVLGNQTTNRVLKKLTLDILRMVEGGASLSMALGKYPDTFSPTYQALVKAGESSGKLDEILHRLAQKMEAERELNSKFKGAMVYPAIVFIAMVGVFFLLMIFVIPKLADMYKSLSVDLPIVTQIMISTSDFMVKNVLIILICMVGAVLGIRYFAKTDAGRDLITEVIFKLPVFGKINRQKEIAQFTRTLSLLISSAVPIVEALNIVSSVCSSSAYKKAALEAAFNVEKGNSLSDYFKANKIFPPLVGQMTGVGQETGRMDEVLDRVASFFDGEVEHLVRGLTAALEPIILIMLGGMVGFLILSIITPIYKLTTAI